MCDHCGVIFVEINYVWPTICKSAPEVKDIVYLLSYLTAFTEKSRNDSIVPVQYL